MRVLIVEDDPVIQELMHLTLEEDFDVELAGTVDAAVQAATEHPFDLFLLDINLGEARNGVDLLEMLRQAPAHTSTPAIACSASIDPFNRRSYIARGFDACLAKPFTYEMLQKTITATLEASRSADHEGAENKGKGGDGRHHSHQLCRPRLRHSSVSGGVA